MQVYFFILAGIILSLIFHFHGIQNEKWYSITTASLLACGLYSSTYSISLSAARQHVKLILSAITIGVALKAFFIGSIVSLLLQNPYGYLLGIIVAQIDPLSTAALQKSKRISSKAKTILAAWSSFDDPMTVLLALYTPAILASFNGKYGAISIIKDGIPGYMLSIAGNIIFALIVFFVWSRIKDSMKSLPYVVMLFVLMGAYAVIFSSFMIAIYYFLMLGIALIGLFMRPRIDKLIHQTVHFALLMAALMLGMLLNYSFNIIAAVILGIAAYMAQILVAYILCRKLSRQDKMHIALAQQNGITAIILSLLFEQFYPGTIAIVAPAIMIINLLHYSVNKAYDRMMSKNYTFSLPSKKKLMKHL